MKIAAAAIPFFFSTSVAAMGKKGGAMTFINEIECPMEMEDEPLFPVCTSSTPGDPQSIP